MNARSAAGPSRKHPGGERYRLELEALSDHDAPAVIRLRSALKTLLRAFRLRCRSVQDVTPAGGATDEGGAT